MTAHHLKPADTEDYQLASDLGRKVGHDVTSAIMRTMALGSSPSQREVTALAAAVAAIACAGHALRSGSAPEATDRDVVEALVSMMANPEARS